MLDSQNIEFIDYFLAEEELIKRLCISKSDNKINFSLFSNLIIHPVGYEGFAQYEGFYITISCLRDKLGLLKNKKPGDIDILIIPYSADKIFFERTCAIEVKVVRPSRNKPRKTPNSSGFTQVHGLIEDGFPLVGLIHVCMTEPLHDNEKHVVKYASSKLDLDNPKNNKELLNNTIDIKLDNFSNFAAVTQMKRLITKEIPKYVGLCAIGVNLSSDGDLILSQNIGFNSHYEAGYFNPHVKI